MNILCGITHSFALNQGLILRISTPTHSNIDRVVLHYRDTTLDLTYSSITKRIDENTRIEIFESLFFDIFGSSPLNLDWMHDKNPSVYVLIQQSLVYNYIGCYDIVWNLQKDIYRMHFHLPKHWSILGKVLVIEKDIPILKWDETPSAYMLSDFNGFYIPHFKGDIEKRVLIKDDSLKSYLLRFFARYQFFQSICIGNSGTYGSTLENRDELISLLILLETDRWEYTLPSLSLDTLLQIGSYIPIDLLMGELYDRMSYSDEKLRPRIEHFQLITVPILASYLMDDRNGGMYNVYKTFPIILQRVCALYILDQEYQPSTLINHSYLLHCIPDELEERFGSSIAQFIMGWNSDGNFTSEDTLKETFTNNQLEDIMRYLDISCEDEYDGNQLTSCILNQLTY